jgi:hypothetical protein
MTEHSRDFAFRTRDFTAVGELPAGWNGTAQVVRRQFVIRRTLWYVFPRLRNVVQLIRGMMVDGDQLLVARKFPSPGSAFVGSEVLLDEAALKREFSRWFNAVRHIWYQDAYKSVNDDCLVAAHDPGCARDGTRHRWLGRAMKDCAAAAAREELWS